MNPSLTTQPAASPHGWRFEVECPGAQQVMLVTQDASGLNSWRPMQACPELPDRWILSVPENSIAGSVRYYTVENGAVLSGGTAGLSAVRTA